MQPFKMTAVVSTFMNYTRLAMIPKDALVVILQYYRVDQDDPYNRPVMLLSLWLSDRSMALMFVCIMHKECIIEWILKLVCPNPSIKTQFHSFILFTGTCTTTTNAGGKLCGCNNFHPTNNVGSLGFFQWTIAWSFWHQPPTGQGVFHWVGLFSSSKVHPVCDSRNWSTYGKHCGFGWSGWFVATKPAASRYERTKNETCDPHFLVPQVMKTNLQMRKCKQYKWQGWNLQGYSQHHWPSLRLLFPQVCGTFFFFAPHLYIACRWAAIRTSQSGDFPNPNGWDTK